MLFKLLFAFAGFELQVGSRPLDEQLANQPRRWLRPCCERRRGRPPPGQRTACSCLDPRGPRSSTSPRKPPEQRQRSCAEPPPYLQRDMAAVRSKYSVYAWPPVPTPTRASFQRLAGVARPANERRVHCDLLQVLRHVSGTSVVTIT